MFSCVPLAAVLADRLRASMQLHDMHGIVPFGCGTDGVWVPAAPVFVNHVMRVSRYAQGNGFAKHRDNGFVFTDDLRSVMTVIVYLTDGHLGGKTVFYCADPPVAVESKRGAGVFFNHDIWHEGLWRLLV